MVDEHHVVFTWRFCNYEVLVGTICDDSHGWHRTFFAVAWFEFTYPGFAIAELTVFAIWSWLLEHVSRFLEGKTG